MAYETVAGADARAAAAPVAAGRSWPHSPGPVEVLGASGAARGPTAWQWLFAAVLIGGLAAGLAYWPDDALTWTHHLVFSLFALVSLARAVSAAITVKARPPPPVLRDQDLPSYTVLAPLYGEPKMVGPLVRALNRLDYPRERLQILLLLEADDDATRAAALAACRGAEIQIVVCPPGHPRTKPRACNIGLGHATGELLVIYDAEDEPAPGQLREAAGRFAMGPAQLACLQAPLRIHHAATGMQRQFALEYAALFEIVLPALGAVKAPFPLGGTSNHFRSEALRRVGGWDAHNVTEDADLGFRMAKNGYQLGVLSLPTRETAPHQLSDWLPQRARWIKGYMQTWGVHTRAPQRLGVRNGVVLTLTVGLAIASAFAHGPACAWLLAQSLIWAFSGNPPEVQLLDMLLLAAGWCASIAVMALGARRARLRMSMGDALLAPLYWALQSPAALIALWQLITRPFHWDKTPHRPPPNCWALGCESTGFAGAAHARDLVVEG